VFTDSATCHGDSGSGVVVSVKNGDKTEWMLRGLISKSSVRPFNNSHYICHTAWPAVVTDIDVFRQWVIDHISQDFGRLNLDKLKEDFKKKLFYEKAESVFQIENNFDIIFNSLASQNFEDLKKYWQSIGNSKILLIHIYWGVAKGGRGFNILHPHERENNIAWEIHVLPHASFWAYFDSWLRPCIYIHVYIQGVHMKWPVFYCRLHHENL
jgi:hypothetical protein